MSDKKNLLYTMGLAYDCCCAVILCLGMPLFLFSKKLRQYLRSRQRINQVIGLVKAAGEKPVFLYCSSIGELEQAMPLITRLKASAIPYFVFAHSQNGLIHARNMHLEHIALTPLDFFIGWQQIFKICQPRLCIVNRHEYWPGFVLNAILRSKLYLVNTVEKDYRNVAYRWYIHWLRRHCAAVFFVNSPKSRAAHFISTGDTRKDRLHERANVEAASIAALRERLTHHRKKVLVLGNAYLEDVEILQKVMTLRPAIPDEWQIVIVPARPGMADPVKAALNAHTHNVVIDASFGKLFSWYQCADAAWIGGGFNDKGIHNTLEAGIAGAVLLSGPNLAQQPDALAAVQAGFLHICENAKACISILETADRHQAAHSELDKTSPTELIFKSIFHKNPAQTL